MSSTRRPTLYKRDPCKILDFENKDAFCAAEQQYASLAQARARSRARLRHRVVHGQNTAAGTQGNVERGRQGRPSLRAGARGVGARGGQVCRESAVLAALVRGPVDVQEALHHRLWVVHARPGEHEHTEAVGVHLECSLFGLVGYVCPHGFE